MSTAILLLVIQVSSARYDPVHQVIIIPINGMRLCEKIKSSFIDATELDNNVVVKKATCLVVQ